MAASGMTKTPHMGRRRLVGLGLGLGTVAVGLFILADQAWVGSLLQPYIGSALGAGDTAAAGLTPYGSLSYIVYAIGFGLVVSGIGLARSVFRSSVSSYVSGGGPAAMGMNPGAMENMMKTSLAQVSAVTAATTPKETVKVKCRNCGSLEPEDAVYCNKCGKPL